MAGFSYDKGTPAVSSYIAKTTTGPGDYFTINHLGSVEVSWERIFPGAAPATSTVALEVCNGDPTVAANWTLLDSDNTVTPANVHKSVANVAATAVRLNQTVITTPGGGVTGTITVRQKGQ